MFVYLCKDCICWTRRLYDFGIVVLWVVQDFYYYYFFFPVGLEDCLIWNHTVVERVCISSMFCLRFALITILRVILATFYSIKIMGHILWSSLL